MTKAIDRFADAEYSSVGCDLAIQKIDSMNPEDVKEAINQMFLCSSLLEHMACYQHYYNELKDCVFVVFSEQEGTELPNALQTSYDNEFAIINLGYANRYYAVNSDIYHEMIHLEN